jgi:hypothetical protein
MSLKDLENIIILLLVIVIVYMIYKRNEKMEAIAYDKHQTQFQPQSESKQESYQFQDIKELQAKYLNEIEGNSDESLRPNLNLDKKCQSEVNQFLDEYMNYSRFGNQIEKISTDEEINAYRKSFLDFRNVTDQSSHGFDPVDRMNLDRINGLYKGGLKIHEVYDKIASSNFDTSKIDLYSMQMNERIDDTIRSNTFEYDNDEVSNGGFFFEKIRGNENISGLKAL